ncbi:ABC transporter ATP-binding protein [Nocardioides endophyticus]|uniref:ABC transporter ATP-binding protein n=1 Tax=Nocardioides endophyticus TaxID=1353775 RepID=A0ABP8YZK1_9ACTN
MAEQLLKVNKVDAGYRRGAHAIRDINLGLHAGDALGVVGMNGAGKSTLMATIAGRLVPENGTVELEGRDLGRMSPDRRARQGLVLLPEGHQVIGALTVEQNLLVASGARTFRGARRRLAAVADLVYGLFPILADRADQLAGLMSGGEQQMLSIGRALVTGPRLLLLDEPSLGLAPAVVDRIYDALTDLRREQLSLVVVEQNDTRLRNLCNKIVVLNSGVVTLSAATEDTDKDAIRRAYFGASHLPGDAVLASHEAEGDSHVQG